MLRALQYTKLNRVMLFTRQKFVHVHVINCFSFILFIVVPASSPPDAHKWVGDIESVIFDEHEGVFSSDKHGVTVIVPPGAIKSGIKAELKFGATLFAAIKPADSKRPVIPVSAIIWLSMGVTLQKSVQVRIPHCVSVNSEAEANKLRFAKSQGDEGTMEAIDGGKFVIGESFGTIEVDDFCCFSIQRYSGDDIQNLTYQAVVFLNKQLQGDRLKFEVCILPNLPTFLEVSILYCVLNS